VYDDRWLNEIVLFELPTPLHADRLMDHVGSARFAWRQPDGAALVGVLLTSDALDLAELLRSVQAWLHRIGLPAIRFEVDGRSYLLEAKRAVQPVG
jgi:hypothetical protein